MSLLVWLPLTADLRNQGIDNATFSIVNNNSKLALNASGKIGKCYERTASGYADTIRSSKNYTLSGDISMACWAYVSSTIGDTANGLITNHNHADCSGVGITVKQVSTSDYRISCNTGQGGSSRTYYSYYGTTNIKNKWCHLALTYNKTNKVLKLWVNGIVEYTLSNYSNYAANNPFDLFNWSTGHYTYGDYRPVCKLNDVRLYDHELSTKEIKELSKGLVIHYKLNDRYSTRNILLNTYGTFGNSNWSNSNISTSQLPTADSSIKASYYDGNQTVEYTLLNHDTILTVSGYFKSTGATTGTTYPSIMPYDADKKFISTYNCAEGFSSTYQTTLAQPLKKGDTVIYATNLSAWTTGDNYYFHVAIFGYKDSYGRIYPDMGYTADSPTFGTKTDKSKINKTNNTITLNSAFTGEDRPAGTVICQATEGSTYVYPFGGIGLSTLSDWTYKSTTISSEHSRLKYAKYIRWFNYYNIYVGGITITDNSWNTTTIYDSSGYNYHGTMNGKLEIINDTPRNSLSIYFPNNSDTVTLTPYLSLGQTLTEMTVSCWFKTNTLNSTAPNMWSLGENSFVRIRLATATSIWYYARIGSTQCSSTYAAGKTLTDNNWHHVIYTFKNGIVTIWLDGIKIGTTDHSSTGTYMTCANVGTSWHLAGYGANSENFIGGLADFRIYATALSADDVQNLYASSAHIDNKGNSYAYEYVEV